MFNLFKKRIEKPKRSVTLEVYKDRGKQWRWRIFAENGKIIANSGEGYKDKDDCVAIADGIARGSNVVERIVPK